VSLEDALRFKKERDIIYFAETSAKSGENVDKLFIDVIYLNKLIICRLQSLSFKSTRTDFIK
jgi:hypothetical protein